MKNIKLIVKLIVVILIIGGAVFAYRKYGMADAKTPKTEQEVKADIAKFTADISKFMVLPAEEPIILDITDPAALVASQPFFQGSIAGDKLLIYRNAAKAVIWSPTRQLVVNVGPVSGNEAAAAQTPVATSTKK